MPTFVTELFTTGNLIALATLTCLEIVLGIDNIVFLTIMVDRLPETLRQKAMRIGLLLAMVARIILLFLIGWVMGLTKPLITLLDHEISGRDLILLFGGLFLIAKATTEIRDKLEAMSNTSTIDQTNKQTTSSPKSSFAAVIGQIVVLDAVFSLDSVITAVGMADNISVIIIAVIVAIAVMMVFAGAIGRFVSANPTLKMLALAFLILVGVLLVAESMHQEINKGYVYFAMAFSLVVELLNLKVIKGIRKQTIANRRNKEKQRAQKS